MAGRRTSPSWPICLNGRCVRHDGVTRKADQDRQAARRYGQPPRPGRSYAKAYDRAAARRSRPGRPHRDPAHPARRLSRAIPGRVPGRRQRRLPPGTLPAASSDAAAVAAARGRLRKSGLRGRERSRADRKRPVGIGCGCHHGLGREGRGGQAPTAEQVSYRIEFGGQALVQLNGLPPEAFDALVECVVVLADEPWDAVVIVTVTVSWRNWIDSWRTGSR